MTEKLTLETLLAACAPGGASVLTIVTELRPAAGPHGAVAPPRYVSGRDATYCYETRYVDGEAQTVVLLDGKSSQLNRVEEQISMAVKAGVEPLCLTPTIAVDYDGDVFLDMDLPHRAWDGHIRAASIDGTPVAQHDAYIAARNCTPADVRALLELSPISLPAGSWDSTRSAHQARFRSVLVAEIIGVLADQSTPHPETPRRGGARRDEIAPSVRVSGPDMKKLVKDQEHELSGANLKRIEETIKKSKETVSASTLGLGSIPPTLSTLGLVSCKRIIRSQVLSFAALRQLRFGGSMEADAACRALLAALMLAGLARANDELVLRANCDLTEAAAPVMELDLRNGRKAELATLRPEEADELLTQAIAEARRVADIRWEGQQLQVTGNPIILKGAEAEPEEA